MSDNKTLLQQGIEIFKYMNAGGIAAAGLIVLIVGMMKVTACGPVWHTSNYGEENLLSGAPQLQDHPEQVVDDGHAGDSHGEHGEAHDDHAPAH